MSTKFFTSMGAVVLMGLSATVYGDGYTKYVLGDGKLPKGDCWEMKCSNGCVEEEGTFTGHCCPSAGGEGDSCSLNGINVNECCSDGLVCSSKGVCVQACEGGFLKDGEYISGTCNVCDAKNRIPVRDEKYLRSADDSSKTGGKKSSSKNKGRYVESSDISRILEKIRQTIQKRRDQCEKCDKNGKIIKAYNEKCQECNGVGGIRDKYDATCQDCDSSTGAIMNKPDGTVVHDGCAVCSGGRFVPSGSYVNLGPCYACVGAYKSLIDPTRSLPCGSQCCRYDEICNYDHCCPATNPIWDGTKCVTQDDWCVSHGKETCVEAHKGVIDKLGCQYSSRLGPKACQPCPDGQYYSWGRATNTEGCHTCPTRNDWTQNVRQTWPDQVGYCPGTNVVTMYYDGTSSPDGRTEAEWNAVKSALTAGGLGVKKNTGNWCAGDHPNGPKSYAERLQCYFLKPN